MRMYISGLTVTQSTSRKYTNQPPPPPGGDLLESANGNAIYLSEMMTRASFGVYNDLYAKWLQDTRATKTPGRSALCHMC